MKTNLALTNAQLDIARKPVIGVEVEVLIATEKCVKLGDLRATAAAAGAYTFAGGAGIPTGGRDVHLRVASSNCKADPAGNMTATFNVVLVDDEGEDVVDTAVATFHKPSYTPHQGGEFPIGVTADLIPATVGNVNFKIKSVGSLVGVTNMVAGNAFEIFTTPDDASFTYIECTMNKGGQLNLPATVEIPCGYNPSAYVKPGRGESQNISISTNNRGPMEQLRRFNGQEVTVVYRIVKESSVISELTIFSGFYVRANGDHADGNAVSEVTAEGPYSSFHIAYPHTVAA